jgi:hypothetical protein
LEFGMRDCIGLVCVLGDGERLCKGLNQRAVAQGRR